MTSKKNKNQRLGVWEKPIALCTYADATHLSHSAIKAECMAGYHSTMSECQYERCSCALKQKSD